MQDKQDSMVIFLAFSEKLALTNLVFGVSEVTGFLEINEPQFFCMQRTG